MKTFSRSREQGALRPLAVLCAAVASALITIGSAQAGPIPANLGQGLYGLVSNRAAPAGFGVQTQLVEPDMLTIDTDNMKRDDAGRVLVNIVLDGRSSYDQGRAAVSAVSGVNITAEDKTYRAGIIEGYVPVDAVVGLAKTKGVSAIHAVNVPVTNVGSVTQQGLVQHRVDQIPEGWSAAGGATPPAVLFGGTPAFVPGDGAATSAILSFPDNSLPTWVTSWPRLATCRSRPNAVVV